MEESSQREEESSQIVENLIDKLLEKNIEFLKLDKNLEVVN